MDDPGPQDHCVDRHQDDDYPYDPISLSHRVEFRNLWNREGLFNYQEFARRYMAPHTPNDSILLFHSLGSGKTITCIAIAVDHYEALGTKTLVITKSVHGHYIFQNEIEKYKTMHGPFNDKEIFSMNSYIEFHNRLKYMTDDEIDQRYSNTIIVMDEIHNIKYQRVNINSVYQQLLRLVMLTHHTRIILSTATPMTDNVDQIGSILTLFADRRIGISYNTVTQNVATTVFMGEKIYDHFFPVVRIPMSRHQQQVYLNTTRLNDVYRSLSQITLFCSTTGEYGREVIQRMMVRDRLQHRVVMASGKHKDIMYTTYRIRDEFIPDLTDDLPITSCKYHYLMSHLDVDGTIFVFIEDVMGSGIIVLLEILRLNGYEPYLGDDITRIRPAPRYTFCVGITDLCPNMEDRIEGFNHPINRHGDYVKIIIGSRVLGESITLKNVRHFHCLIPHWNDSVVIQSLGRVLRSNSHDDLDEDDRQVQVHIYCATLDDDVESIDEKKIRISNTKQTKIVQMTQHLQELSIERYVIHTPLEHTAYYVDDFIRHYIVRYIPVFRPCFDTLYQHRDSYTLHEIEELLDIDRKVTRHVLIKWIVDNIPVNGRLLRTFRDRVFTVENDPSRAYITVASGTLVPKTLLPIQLSNPPPPSHTVLEKSSESEMLATIRTELTARDLEHLVETVDRSAHPIFARITRHVVIDLDDTTTVHTLCYTKTYDMSYKAAVPIPSVPSGLRILTSHGWTTCDPDHERSLLPRLRDHIDHLIHTTMSRYPIYGIISTIDMQMRISTRITESRTRDRRMRHRGRMLYTLTKETLATIRHILSHDEVYDRMWTLYHRGERVKSLSDLCTSYSDDTNPTLIRDIEQMIIRRGLYILI